MQPLVLMSGRGLREPSGRLAGPAAADAWAVRGAPSIRDGTRGRHWVKARYALCARRLRTLAWSWCFLGEGPRMQPLKRTPSMRGWPRARVAFTGGRCGRCGTF